jgi:hypothetical protein
MVNVCLIKAFGIAVSKKQSGNEAREIIAKVKKSIESMNKSTDRKVCASYGCIKHL